MRTILFFIERISLNLTRKTKTTLDDKLVQKSSRPLTILAFLLSLKFVLEEIVLTKNTMLISTNIIYTLLIIVIAYLAYIVVDIVIINAIKKLTAKTKSNVDDSLISLMSSVLKTALVVVCLLYILDLWGIQIGPLLAGLGIAGLAVALALQPILSNIFSGAAMIFDRSISVGDLVYLDADTKGKIEKIGLRSTKIKTFDNEWIIVPNNKLSESNIQNVALPEPKSRTVIPFGVAYGSDIEKVKKIVLKEIKSLKHLEKDPEPTVKFLEMADSSLNFKAYFYVDSFENRFNAIDEANTKIYNALTKNKIEIPFPQLDVNLKK